MKKTNTPEEPKKMSILEAQKLSMLYHKLGLKRFLKLMNKLDKETKNNEKN